MPEPADFRLPTAGDGTEPWLGDLRCPAADSSRRCRIATRDDPIPDACVQAPAELARHLACRPGKARHNVIRTYRSRQMRSTGGSVAGLSRGHCQGYLWPMDPEDGPDAEAGIRDVRIRGSRLLLRALQPGEIEEEWRAMVTADPMVIAGLPRRPPSRPGSSDRVTWKMAGSISPSTWTVCL